jgi:AcrR family transcriptional regulator
MTSDMAGETGSGTLDRRRQRSERTRQHLIEAYLALLRVDPRPPTASRIAERAGYSVRSLFERFPDLLTLSLAAADVAFARAHAQSPVRNLDADRATRIRSQVEDRARTCEDWLPLWRALVLNQHLSEELQRFIRRARAALLARIELMYRPELDSLETTDRRRVLIALEAITDFESWARMRETAELSVEQGREVWIRAIDSLLPGTPAVS